MKKCDDLFIYPIKARVMENNNWAQSKLYKTDILRNQTLNLWEHLSYQLYEMKILY